MRCLVLGGAGFIGSYLTEDLVRQGNRVVIYESPMACLRNIDAVVDDVEIVRGDFTAEDRFDRILTGVDIVFHLISTSVPKTSNDDIMRDLDHNVKPALNLLESCVRTGVKKFVFFSSGGTVYGNASDIPIREDHSQNPICAYGVHKLAIEKYIQLYHHLYGLDYRIVRISNPYGARQSLRKPQGVVSAFLALALENKPLELWGDGSVIRDFVYVSDVIRAVEAVTHYEGDLKIFNIGRGIGTSVLDLISAISEIVGRRPETRFLPSQKQDATANVLDISRITGETGWLPTVTLREGLTMMYRCWQNSNSKRLSDNTQTDHVVIGNET
jgi:UDP-glucose 4-epimerase